MNFTRKQLVLGAAIGGGVAALGTLLPWASAYGTGAFAGMVPASSWSGIDSGKGWFVLILALVGGGAALLVHLGKAGQVVKQLNETQHLWASLGALGVALIVVLVQFFNDGYQSQEFMGTKVGVSRGFGLWLCLLGSAAGAAAAFMATRGTNPMTGAANPPAPPAP
jgi:hypothetical protein